MDIDKVLDRDTTRFFSRVYPTKEQAQDDFFPTGLFDAGAIFQTAGGFVSATLRQPLEWPPYKALNGIEKLTWYKAVSYQDPLLRIWHDYKSEVIK